MVFETTGIVEESEETRALAPSFASASPVNERPSSSSSTPDGRNYFSAEIIESHPELKRVLARCLTQAYWEETTNGQARVIVPTDFHAQRVREVQRELSRLINRSIVDVETRRPGVSKANRSPHQQALSFERRPAYGSPPSPSQVPKQQFTIPLPRVVQKRDDIEEERKHRVRPPRLISSKAFMAPAELSKRWADQVNSGMKSQTLWIHGPSGSGKTALVKQFHEWIDLKLRLRSTDVMQFFHEWRRSLEDKDHLSFVRKYRKELDVLILEDIDDLQGKTKTQQEVLFTVNALLDSGASVVTTSTRHPLELQEILEPALYSRLFSGLLLEMPRPDHDFKEKLWRQLIEDYGLADFSIDVHLEQRLLSFPVDTARKANTLFINAIGRLSLKRKLEGTDLAELESLHCLQGQTTQHRLNPSRPTQPSQILDEVSRLCGVSKAAVLGKVRRANIIIARRFACLALARFAGLTNAAIAEVLEKDPSTISHALKTVEIELKKNRHIAEQWNWICSQLGMPLEAQ